MNQGELEVVKQETARVNNDSLGISELKWTGMGEFNTDDHFIYYYGQESLRSHGVALKLKKSVWNAELVWNLKNNRMISVRFQGNPFFVTAIQVYAPSAKTKEAEVCFQGQLAQWPRIKYDLELFSSDKQSIKMEIPAKADTNCCFCQSGVTLVFTKTRRVIAWTASAAWSCFLNSIVRVKDRVYC